MEGQLSRNKALIEMDFLEPDDGLARLADRLGGAPTAGAGLESGTLAWDLALFTAVLPKVRGEVRRSR
jgi:hypothetical protein